MAVPTFVHVDTWPSLHWYTKLVFLIWISMIDVAASKQATEPRVSCGKVRKLYGRNCDLLIATEYLFHRRPRIVSVCHGHSTALLIPCLTYHRIFNLINTTGVKNGAGTVHHSSGLLRLPTVIDGVRAAQSLVFYYVLSIFSIFYPFSFGHCIVCPLMYGVWLPI
jgi:hypothetical protein